MRLHLLGPVEVSGPDGPLRLGGRKERAVLAMLALAPATLVSEEALISGLWNDPPRTAAATLHAYVSRLRRALVTGVPDEERIQIETRPGGYRLLTPPDGVDVGVVERLVMSARRAADAADHSWAAVAFGQALREWRGRPLTEFADEPFAATAAARLAELHTTINEDRIEAELACGQHAALVGELEALTTELPLRERLWGQRMLALYRSGRQAESLQVYEQVRRTFQRELGIDPGPALSRLQQAVLRQEPDLDWVAPPPLAGDPVPAPASALPSGVVTLLLTDIADSTPMWDRDATAMAIALDRHDAIVSQVVTARAGHLIKARGEGDSTLSVFARASAAVAAAVELRAAVQAEPWPEGLAVLLRVAVHTGEAQERDGDYVGPTVNRAARVRGLAAGGQILISEATAAVVGDALPSHCTLLHLGPHQLRGLSRLERVLEIRDDTPELAESPGPQADWLRDNGDQLATGLLSYATGALFGRESELTRLRGLLRTAEIARCRLVLVAGEPGIGKTRLAAQAAWEVARKGAVVLHGRCHEDLDVPFQPFIEALQPYLANAPLADLRRHTRGGAAELARLLPVLSERFPGLPAPTHAEAGTERYLLFRAVADLLASVAASRPVLLVLDDLHWAAPSTLLLLGHLAREGTPRLSLLATFRDTEVDGCPRLTELVSELRQGGRAEVLALQGLDPPAIAAWVAASAGRSQAAADLALAESLCEQTGGNPFFVEEAVGELAAGGAPGRPALTPGTRDAVTNRLGRLGPATNRVLAAAAVIGSDFSLPVLEAIPELEGIDLLDALEEALRARVLLEVPQRFGHYTFAHALLRHTVYASLTTSRRVRLHRHVGEAIAAGPDAAAQAGALAYHFAEAAPDGQADACVSFALLAGQRALERLGFEEASTVAERALRVIESLPGDFVSQRFDLLLLLAEARQRQFDRLGAKVAALAAADLARAMGSPAHLVRAALLAAPERWVGQPGDDLIAVYEDALTATEHRDVATRARLLASLVIHRSMSQEGWNAGPLATEALSLARAAGDIDAQCLALDARCWTLWGSAESLTTLALSSELIELGRRHGHPLHEANGRFWRAQARLALGDLDAFVTDSDAILGVSRRMRSGVDEARHGMFQVLRAMLDGRFDEVETLAQVPLVSSAYDADFVYAHFGQVFWLCHEQGRLAEIEPLLAGWDAPFAQKPAVLASQALVLADGDRTEELREFLQSPEVELTHLPRELSWTGALAMFTEAATVAGADAMVAELYELLQPFRERLLVVGGALCPGAGARYLGMAATALGELTDAEDHLRAAEALETAVSSRPLLARTRIERAALLLQRRAPGDVHRGRQLARQVRDVAKRLGMAGVERRAAALMQS